MTLQEAIHATLTAGSPALKVAFGIRPSEWGSADGVVFNIISDIDDEHLSGDSGYIAARVQVDAWSQNALRAEAMQIDARALMRTSVLLSAFTVGGFRDRDEETGLYRASKDYSVGFNT